MFVNRSITASLWAYSMSTLSTHHTETNSYSWAVPCYCVGVTMTLRRGKPDIITIKNNKAILIDPQITAGSNLRRGARGWIGAGFRWWITPQILCWYYLRRGWLRHFTTFQTHKNYALSKILIFWYRLSFIYRLKDSYQLKKLEFEQFFLINLRKYSQILSIIKMKNSHLRRFCELNISIGINS